MYKPFLFFLVILSMIVLPTNVFGLDIDEIIHAEERAITIKYDYVNGNFTLNDFETLIEPDIQTVSDARFSFLTGYLYESNWSAIWSSDNTNYIIIELKPEISGTSTLTDGETISEHNLYLYDLKAEVEEDILIPMTVTMHFSWGDYVIET